ncbi:GATS protein-like 3 [Gryganskiella cystojenkinii]|nr:GATS protein-like 3 [Gryganskiella cystojenkinii]
MKLVLFPSGPQHFFSYTETDKEVSLILDESHLSGFPAGALNVCNVIWRAVQIEPGECGQGTVEVVSQVSRPLADINVSIMQISTYDADFTLVPECDLQRALECLSKIFNISNNPLEDVGLQVSDLQSWDKSYPESPTGAINSLQGALRERQSSQSDGSIPDELLKSTVKARHPFNANYPHRLHITSMEQSLMDMLAIRLLESIFFDNRQDRFFSFTQTDTTLSMIMDDQTLSVFPEHTLNTQEGDWRLIAIGDGPLGFDECGIVSEFSRPLSEVGIGLFYLSTFNSDYIMVNDQDFEEAVSCLEETAKIAAQDAESAAAAVEAAALALAVSTASLSLSPKTDNRPATPQAQAQAEARTTDDFEGDSDYDSEAESVHGHDRDVEPSPLSSMGGGDGPRKYEDEVEIVFTD